MSNECVFCRIIQRLVLTRFCCAQENGKGGVDLFKHHIWSMNMSSFLGLPRIERVGESQLELTPIDVG